MTRARVLAHGTLHCFPIGLRDAQGNPVNAEVSAVVHDGERLILASDKPIPGEERSAVFAVDVDGEGRPDEASLVYFTQPLIKQATKYEDFALTADGRHVLATTGFDRIAEDSHALNAYNHLLIWPLGNPDAVSVVDPDPRDGVEGSLELRAKLDAAIGTPYYKIEGLAAIPGERGDGLLLFGVREQGKHHDNFEYVCRVVGAHYRVSAAGNLTFVDELRSLYRFDPERFEAVRHVCGLSSLEYDPYNHRLYLLTSFETEQDGVERIGGYLWVMSLDDFTAGREPQLVGDESGAALEFEHKAEGLAVLDAARLFVAYDNDRHLGLGAIDARDERHASEAPYTVLAMDA
ncbi:hypothetical protein [Modicisalibacter tunisiensis]|uniref:DUF3616 domain-containing protein n=1 Tax=Modicisalibacter tunisiensis TaxID=390637 RepID=A0ABS7WZH3_9GAMM|nr:hypothetical protein [Modicisalibacter tunisiensis]MBZ9539342.1 hypothetical protein [Modicisalibacter tunisiensis]MBZ9567261.1 hypothetical protein [Modicisalibacter tunisiensis]